VCGSKPNNTYELNSKTLILDKKEKVNKQVVVKLLKLENSVVESYNNSKSEIPTSN